MDILAIKHSIAKAIYANTSLQAYCTGLFGQGMAVWCDDVGTNREAEAEDSRGVPTPYCVVSVDGETQGGMNQEFETGTIDIEVVMNASQTPNGSIDATKREQSTDGYFKSAANGALETLTEAVRLIAAANGHGAIANGYRTEYDGKLYYPLQFANVYADFIEIREG
jgi:hypothetical protein